MMETSSTLILLIDGTEIMRDTHWFYSGYQSSTIEASTPSNLMSSFSPSYSGSKKVMILESDGYTSAEPSSYMERALYIVSMRRC